MSDFKLQEPGVKYVDIAKMIGLNLYVVDIEDGVIRKAKINKSYFRNEKKVIVKKYWIEDKPNLFYVLAKNKEDAEKKYITMFAEIDKKISEKNKLTN